MSLPEYLKNLSQKQLRRRTELRLQLRCPECKDMMLIGDTGLVCGRAHGRIRCVPAGSSLGELVKLFPELAIEHGNGSAERSANLKGLLG